MGCSVFGLMENPFTILGATPRSTKADINEAVEEARLDADGIEAERRLDLARQALIAPNERLRAELGFLLELRPAEARKVLRSRQFQDWLDVAQSAAGLSRLNILVEALSCAPDMHSATTIFQDLIVGWSALVPKSIVNQINEERSIAGFSDAQTADVRNALTELRAFHASKALEAIDNVCNLSAFLTDMLTSTLIPERRAGEAFVTASLDEYAKRVGSALASSADRALATLDAYSISGSETDYVLFETALEAWDALAQPMQLASEAKGADEAHSKDLYDQIRSKAIELANDEGRHHEALQITKLSERIFAELPWAAEALKKDAQVLNNLIANKTRDEHLLPLAAALNEAREDLFWTSRHLSAHGFSSSSPDPIGAIWAAYVDLLSHDVDQEIRDVGANLVRNLSITLFNERQEPVQAKMLTSQLAADADWFSQDVRDQIAEDDEYLNRSVMLEYLLATMKREDWTRAKDLCENLIQVSPASELDGLRKIEGIIDQKISSRTFNRIVWGGIAAAIIGLIVFNENKTSNYEEPAYEPSYLSERDYPVPDNDPDAAITDLIEEVGPLIEEAPPSPYAAGPLSLAELRYCLRQSERLDAARGLVESYSQQTRFNSAISDFNSRCSSFRYRESDMAVAQSEISTLRAKLADEAAEIVGSGSVTPPPIYTAPSGNSYGDQVVDDPRGIFDADSNDPYGEVSEE
jgi:hypothetical protein